MIEARVRIRYDIHSRNVVRRAHRLFMAGEELTMMQFKQPDGRWWTLPSLDGAYLVPSDAVAIVEIVDPKPYNAMLSPDK